MRSRKPIDVMAVYFFPQSLKKSGISEAIPSSQALDRSVVALASQDNRRCGRTVMGNGIDDALQVGWRRHDHLEMETVFSCQNAVCG